VALDPLSSVKHAALGWGYYFARRYQRALDPCRRAVEIDPGLPVAHHWLALAFEQMGDLEEAERAMRHTVELSNRDENTLASLAAVLARRGKAEEARSLLADLMERRLEVYVSAYDIAAIHCALGETAQALDWLEQAYAERTHRMAFLRVDPRLDPLRGEPRFIALLDRMRFPA
jgi:tetratricopeptide (TPR) repeat protein